MRDNLVITILAAGEGKRMMSNIPKVLHLFDGKPMLARIIETSLLLNPKKIQVITGKHDELIKKTLREYLDTTSLQFVNQSIPLGTGDAIKCCLPFYDDGVRVLILNGDMPLINNTILENFIENDYAASILVAKFENATGYGRIIYDDVDEFIGIVEEKDCTDEERNIKIINSGLYLIDGDLLREFVPKITNDNAQKEYYLTDIVKLMKNGRNVSVKTHLLKEEENKYISGVNTPEELKNLEYSAV
jgi:UDP-N-acetylglucosamine diphosphorylase/glucosamine-1-phosphate N-acetyltransferase